MNKISGYNSQQKKYSTAKTGAIAGFIAGTADVAITTTYNKYGHKKAIKEFKIASYKDKKVAVQHIKEHYLNVNNYKQYVKRCLETPLSLKNMLTRGVLYGGILCAVGALLDLKERNNAKQ